MEAEKQTVLKKHSRTVRFVKKVFLWILSIAVLFALMFFLGLFSMAKGYDAGFEQGQQDARNHVIYLGQ